MKTLTRALLVATMLIPAAAKAQETKISAEDRKAIVEDVVKYFMDNPQKLIDAVAEARAKEMEAAKAKMFTGAAAAPTSGPQDAPYSVMVFSDYGCAACVTVERDLDRIVAARQDVKVVHNDFPVHGEDATAASLDILAAYNSSPRQDWEKLRERLMVNGVGPEARIASAAEAGVLLPAEPDPSVKLALLKNKEIAKQADLKTLPSVLILKGENVIALSGQDVTYDNINAALAKLSD